MIMQNIDLYDEVVLTENVSGDIRLDMNVDFCRRMNVIWHIKQPN